MKQREKQPYDVDFDNGIISKVKPLDIGDNFVSFMNFLAFSVKQSEAIAEFEKDLKVNLTNIDLSDLDGESSLENKKILQSFIDWVATHHWGLEEENADARENSKSK